MELKFEIIGARELKNGDIFYCTPDFDLNEFGENYLITGTDQIFIKDDDEDDEDEDGNFGVLVNGGGSVWFTEDDKVIRLAHYRDLVRIIAMVKEGNPEMQVGPNDSQTIIEKLKEDNPDFGRDLLKDLDIDLDKLIKDEENKNFDDLDDDDLPF